MRPSKRCTSPTWATASKRIYARLPWSPTTIWTDAEYDAELTVPITIRGPQPRLSPRPPSRARPPTSLRLAFSPPLSSVTDHHGAPVIADRPLLTPDGNQVLFPEGTKITGHVTLSRPARWFGRNGQLRFTFRSMAREDTAPAVIHGQLAAAETSGGAHIAISEEGRARSSSGPGKYLAPMALGVKATSAFDGDATSNPVRSGVDGNGFGFAVRVLVMASANAVLLRSSAVFAVSKSIYYGWIAKGYEVEFPKTAASRSC